MEATRRFFVIVLLLLGLNPAFSQSAPMTYFIQFTDKNNTPFSVTAPSQFLSARSIERRVRQGIAVNAQDLPVDPVYMDSVLSYPGVTHKCHSKWFNAVTVTVTDTNVINQIRNLGFVWHVRMVETRAKSRDFVKEPMVPRSNEILYEDNEYGKAWNQIHLMNGEFLHHLGYRGEGLLVGVLDAGFTAVPDMFCFSNAFADGRITAVHNFPLSNNNLFYNGAQHGSLVLACMAGDMPGTFIGTAPGASYMLWVTENDTSEYPVEEDYWVAGAEAADSAGVDVINTSLGYSLFDDTLMNHTYSQMDGNTTRISIGVDMAAARGILCVNSAGNAGGTPWFYITAPADADSVLTVGAVGPDRVYANFSSKGPSADGRVKPNVATQGFHSQVYWTSNQVVDGSGTSFSSPIMAGMAACLWQAFPDKKNMEILHAIEMSASHFTNPDSLTGYGIPNMEVAYHLLKGTALASNDLQCTLLGNIYSPATRLQLYSGVQRTVTIQLLDCNGKNLVKTDYLLNADEYRSIQVTGDMNLVSPGLYFLKITSGNFTRTEKIVKF